MHLPTTRSLLGAAIAATLLLASPAMAKPMDNGPRPAAPASGTVAKQDLRGEHARDAARAVTHAPPKQDLRGEQARYPDPPPATRTAPPATSAPKSLPAADNGSRPDTWLLIALGLAGVVIVAAGTSGLARARRMA